MQVWTGQLTPASNRDPNGEDPYRARLDGVVVRLEGRTRSVPGDGLLVALLRQALGRYAILWARAVYVPLIGILEKPATGVSRFLFPDQEPAADEVFAIAIDLYKFLMGVLTGIAYAMCCALPAGTWLGSIAAGLIAIAVRGRLLELAATTTLLFFTRPSRAARASFRPVANAFWSYVEYGLAFAVLFRALCVLDPSSIIHSSSGASAADSFFSMVYFSFITVATIGYGDMVPRSSLARLLVCGESLIGLFLIVALVQKAINRMPPAPTAVDSPPEGIAVTTQD